MPGPIIVSAVLLFVALTAAYLFVRRVLKFAADLVASLDAGNDRFDQHPYGDIPTIPAEVVPISSTGARDDLAFVAGNPFDVQTRVHSEGK